MMKNPVKLIFSIFICQMAGVVGSVFTAPSIPTWYAGIAKPAFSPPNWVFAPVWLTLYTLMGIALYLVWQKGWQKKEVKNAIYIFAVQLVLNSIWSIIFFGFRNPGLAFLEIIILWVFIALSIVKFAKINKQASYLLIPYLLWVSFASILNFSIWQLN